MTDPRTLEQEMHDLIVSTNLRQAGCLAAEPCPETIALERWCALGSDVALGFAVGFVVVAWWLS